MKIARLKIDRITSAFRKTEAFRHISTVAMAGFEERLTGGFRRIIMNQPSWWEPLSQRTLKTKERKGLNPSIWIATGRTLAQLNSGPITKVGTAHGINFKISKNAIAYAMPTRLNKRIARAKSGHTTLWDLNNFGHGWRPFTWQPEEMGLMEPYIIRAIQKVLQSEGIAVAK